MSRRKEDRTYKVFTLYPADRDLIRLVGIGSDTRHDGLLQLVPYVENLPDQPDISEAQRRPIRIGIPTVLDQAITARKERTGQTYISILLDAVRRYRKDNPIRG